MSVSLNIIVCEDYPGQNQWIRRELYEYGVEFPLRSACSLEEYMEILRRFIPDIIFYQRNTKEIGEPDAKRIQEEHVPSATFLVISDTAEEALAGNYQKVGAHESFSDSNLVRLKDSIAGVVERKQLLFNKIKAKEFQSSIDERYYSLFENSVIPIFEEDFSQVRQFFDELKAKGVEDFRYHFDNHPEDVVKCSTLIRICDINAESVRFFNAPGKEELLGDMMIGFLDETWPFFKEEIIALAEGKTSFECEMPVSTYNWDHKEVILKLTVRPDCFDTLKHVIVSFVDITPRKQAEAALAESEEIFRIASDNAIIGVFMLTTEYDFMFANSAVCDMLGYKREELMNLNFRDVIDEEDAESGIALLEQMSLGKIHHTNYEQRYRHKSGTVIWTSVSTGIIHSALRRKDYFVSYVQDITSRKEAEVTIQKNAELYCTLTENMKDVVWILDPESLYFKYVSPSSTKMVGFTPEEIMQVPMTALIPPEYREKLTKDIQKIISDCASGKEKPGTYHTQTILQPCKDGSFINAELSVYAFPNPDTGKLELRGAHRDVTAYRNAEDQLKKSEEKFRLLFENAADPIQLLDENLRFIDCNEATMQILGARNKYDVLSCYPADISPEYQPDGQSSLDKSVWLVQTAYQRGSHQFEWVHKRFDGILFTVDINLTRIFMDGKDLLLVHWRDITERKKIEVALRKSEEQFRLLAENTTDVIWTMDINEKNLYISPSVQRLRGYTPEEALLLAPEESLSPQSLAMTKEYLEKAREKIARGERFETINLILEQPSKDNSYVWVDTSISGVYDENDRFLCFLGVSRDITDKRKAELELKESQENFRILIESQGEGAGIINMEEVFVFANPAVERIFDVPPGKLVNRNLREFLLEDQIRQIEEETIKRSEGLMTTYELEIITDKGDIKILLITATPQYNQAGEISGTFGIFRDITEQKKAEAALVAAKEKAEENDRLKTAFLNNISHEIRTPMNAIIGFSGFLNEPDLQPEKRKYFTDIICNASNQLLSIITDIINISTIEAGQETIRRSKINVNQLIRNLYNQFEIRVTGHYLKLFYQTPLPDDKVWIETDETKLVQILSNLVGNALKFTKEGHIVFGYEVKENQLEFRVEDTGIGIHPNMHKEIFERFRQADSAVSRLYGGTGLGLSISKAYVELLGGTIWLTSQLDKGTTFFFTLPFEIQKNGFQVDTSAVAGNTFSFSKKMTVLVAEDEDFNFLLLEKVLDELGLNLIRAENGAKAVLECKSNPSIQLVLMDVKMPVMDGYEATKLIKQDRPELPVLIQTAYVRESDKQKAYESGADGYISKPIIISEFISQLHQLLPKEKQLPDIQLSQRNVK